MYVVANRGGRNRRCLMKKERMRRMTIAAVTFAAVAVIAMQASAGIRIVASVNTPAASVHVCTVPSCNYRIDYDRRVDVRRHAYYEITNRDKRIARRLAYFTGVPARKLVNLRRRGFRWAEIGDMIHLPRPVVRAAFSQKSWDRFLRQERRHAKMYGKHKQHVTYYDGREYRGR
jgi:hypothetical protein